jgi:hypothetical protein
MVSGSIIKIFFYNYDFQFFSQITYQILWQDVEVCLVEDFNLYSHFLICRVFEDNAVLLDLS